jgi:hypothetical protein
MSVGGLRRGWTGFRLLGSATEHFFPLQTYNIRENALLCFARVFQECSSQGIARASLVGPNTFPVKAKKFPAQASRGIYLQHFGFTQQFVAFLLIGAPENREVPDLFPVSREFD